MRSSSSGLKIWTSTLCFCWWRVTQFPILMTAGRAAVERDRTEFYSVAWRVEVVK